MDHDLQIHDHLEGVKLCELVDENVDWSEHWKMVCHSLRMWRNKEEFDESLSLPFNLRHHVL